MGEVIRVDWKRRRRLKARERTIRVRRARDRQAEPTPVGRRREDLGAGIARGAGRWASPAPSTPVQLELGGLVPLRRTAEGGR
jgi:hypothetical protein